MICTLGMRSMKIIILEFIHKMLISNKRKLKIKKKNTLFNFEKKITTYYLYMVRLVRLNIILDKF